ALSGPLPAGGPRVQALPHLRRSSRRFGNDTPDPSAIPSIHLVNPKRIAPAMLASIAAVATRSPIQAANTATPIDSHSIGHTSGSGPIVAPEQFAGFPTRAAGNCLRSASPCAELAARTSLARRPVLCCCALTTRSVLSFPLGSPKRRRARYRSRAHSDAF